MFSPASRRRLTSSTLDTRRILGVFDVLAEGLAQDIDAGEQFAARGRPTGRAMASIDDVGIAERLQLLARARSKPFVAGVVDDDARRAARHEGCDLHLDLAQRQRRAQQNVPCGRVHADLAHVQHGDLAHRP